MILHIPQKVWQQLRYYVELSLPNEVTGIGAIRIDDAENCTVTEVLLPYQHVNPGFSEFDTGALNTIITDFVGDNPALAGLLRFRWHSHGNGKVFWSSIDEDDIASWRGPWVVNLLTNAKGDLLTRLDLFQPFHQANIPLRTVIDYPDDEKLLKACRSEMAAKVKLIPPLSKGGRKDERFF